jgi:hypothetical protein
MRMLIASVFLGALFSSAQAGESLPLFGSEASGIVEVTQQQASLTESEACVDQTCPTPRKAVIHAAAQDIQP